MALFAGLSKPLVEKGEGEMLIFVQLTSDKSS